MSVEKNIAILAGGTSGERPISLKTAAQIAVWLEQTNYTPWVIDVQHGVWLYSAEDGETVSVDKNDFSLSLREGRVNFCAAFIATHGTPGENGLLQGYLEMMRIPYTTGDTFSEALTFHKSACKAFLRGVVPLIPSIDLRTPEQLDAERVREELGYPLFVKPNDNGSSVGVRKVHREEELLEAVLYAFTQGADVMLERGVQGVEVSCGMVSLRGEHLVFPITELISPVEFFDFQTKYDGSTQEITPARISEEVAGKVRQYTSSAYERLRCRGIARADFIIEGNTPYFLEINTVPGMTDQSIVPQQVRAMGCSMPALLAELLDEIVGA